MKKWLVSNFYEPEEVLVINDGEGTEYNNKQYENYEIIF